MNCGWVNMTYPPPKRKANSRVHSLHFRFILLRFKIHSNYDISLMQTPGCLRNYYTIAKSRTQSNIVPTCRLIYQISSEEKQQRDCGEGQKTADTYKECRPFLPLSRLFCSVVLLQQNVLTEPLKKPVLNWADTHT